MTAIYKPLSGTRPEIRLLRLLPSETFGDTIRCELQHACLDDDDAPEYEALSYVWGAPVFSQAIELEGRPFHITRNLESALRHLRLPAGVRTVWADALCINQEDAAERSRQVSLMKTIYSRCTADLAWLGPNPSDKGPGSVGVIQRGMRLMKRIQERDAETLQSMQRRRGSGAPSDGDAADGGRWLLGSSDGLSLSCVFSYPRLWSRIWVMQELASAREVVLVAGTETLRWSSVDAFLGDTPYADAFHIPWGHHGTSGMVAKVFGRVQTVQQQRRVVRDVAEAGYVSTLMDVLGRFKFAESSDPRDMIYGLLGLVSESHGIRVDYTKSVEEVFVEVTRSLVDSTGTLDILCQSPWQAEEGDARIPSLPSWVADFTYSGRSRFFDEGLTSMLFAQRGIFAAGRPSCGVPVDVVDGRLLRLAGVVIGEVGPILQDDDDSSSVSEERTRFDAIVHYKHDAKARLWMHLYFGYGMLDDRSSSTYAITGEPLFQAYWRTLATDCKAYPIERLSEENFTSEGDVFEELIRTEFPAYMDQANYAVLRDILKRLASARMWQRNYLRWIFSVSTNGLFLMLRKGTRKGDVVAVLDGAKVPCVLRPIHDEDGIRYVFVGTAYVHGYMDGLAGIEVEQGRLRKQDFLVA